MILNLEEENVSVAKENLDLAFEELKIGTFSPLEFREVQKSYTAAQSRLSTARYAAKMNEKNLLLKKVCQAHVVRSCFFLAN
ncbi:MAG: TolC family protein [Ignavibacteriales bacterium]|nr:TolC family protein [Ignavibacteriales bacterium]